MTLIAFWSLITGRTPGLSLMVSTLAACWASAYFSGRGAADMNDMDAPPTRKDLVWAVACAPFAILGLGFWGYQLAIGLDKGILLVARNWTVSWADYPFGFAFTIAMYLVFAALMLAMLYYSWFTIREWIDERRAATERR